MRIWALLIGLSFTFAASAYWGLRYYSGLGISYFNLPVERGSDGEIADIWLPIRSQETGRVCICWPYQTCEVGPSPPEGTFRVSFSAGEDRAASIAFYSFIDEGRRISFHGDSQCLPLTLGSTSFLSLQRVYSSTYYVSLRIVE